jgi:hypothetical protein
MKKYGNANLWRFSCRLFDLMPIGALIDNEVLCIHGEEKKADLKKVKISFFLIVRWFITGYWYTGSNAYN